MSTEKIERILRARRELTQFVDELKRRHQLERGDVLQLLSVMIQKHAQALTDLDVPQGPIYLED